MIKMTDETEEEKEHKRRKWVFLISTFVILLIGATEQVITSELWTANDTHIYINDTELLNRTNATNQAVWIGINHTLIYNGSEVCTATNGLCAGINGTGFVLGNGTGNSTIQYYPVWNNSNTLQDGQIYENNGYSVFNHPLWFNTSQYNFMPYTGMGGAINGLYINLFTNHHLNLFNGGSGNIMEVTGATYMTGDFAGTPTLTITPLSTQTASTLEVINKSGGTQFYLNPNGTSYFANQLYVNGTNSWNRVCTPNNGLCKMGWNEGQTHIYTLYRLGVGINNEEMNEYQFVVNGSSLFMNNVTINGTMLNITTNDTTSTYSYPLVIENPYTDGTTYPVTGLKISNFGQTSIVYDKSYGSGFSLHDNDDYSEVLLAYNGNYFNFRPSTNPGTMVGNMIRFAPNTTTNWGNYKPTGVDVEMYWPGSTGQSWNLTGFGGGITGLSSITTLQGNGSVISGTNGVKSIYAKTYFSEGTSIAYVRGIQSELASAAGKTANITNSGYGIQAIATGYNGYGKDYYGIYATNASGTWTGNNYALYTSGNNYLGGYTRVNGYVKIGECSGGYVEGDMCYNSTSHKTYVYNSTDLVPLW